MIKTEKELLRLIWKEMGLGGHNSDMKKRIAIAKEVHKAVEFGLKDCPPGEKKRSPRHSTRICCQATSAKIT